MLYEETSSFTRILYCNRAMLTCAGYIPVTVGVPAVFMSVDHEVALLVSFRTNSPHQIDQEAVQFTLVIPEIICKVLRNLDLEITE